MKKGRIHKLLPSIIIAIICISLHYTSITYSFSTIFDISNSLLYHFSHANIFHLALNLIALFQFRPRWKTCVVAYISASVAAMIPFAAIEEPTCGLSGFLFASYSRRYFYWKKKPYMLIASNLMTAFVPHMNWRIHILSFLIAYLIYALQDITIYK